MNRLKIFLRFFSVSLLVILLSTCATSPTGRKTITLMSDSQMNSMGIQAFNQTKEQTTIETNASVNKYVKCVANAILQVAKDDTGVESWEVVVFRSNQVNAFALPGGKIGVYTAILQVANTQEQLAAILGHEVGHVIARHSNERASQSMLVTLGTNLASAFSSNNKYHTQIMSALGMGTQIGLVLPFSRTHESEADYLGLKLMAQAGFDPHAAVSLWENMSKLSSNQTPEILSTHPSNSTRIQKLNAAMEEAMQLYTQAHSEGKNPKCK